MKIRKNEALKTLGCLAVLLPATHAVAAQNLIDHKLNKDTGGIYKYQNAVPVALGLATAAEALYDGTESRLGRTAWQSGEAFVLNGVTVTAMKYAFGRERPSQTDDPNQWFKGSHAQSFPSGHVSATAALVTPYVLEYKDDHPWVWGLEALPVYEMVARVKAQAHWQTDVVAAMAIGTAFGYYEHQRKKPIIVTLLPGGAFVGWHKKFP